MMVGAPTRSGNTLRFPWAAPDPSTQSVSVKYTRSLSGAKYIVVRKSVFFGYELKLLISTADGRFPRAWLEPRANRMLVMKALRQDVATLAFHPACRTPGSQGSWDCTIVRPTEDLLLFPQDKESSGSITSHEENRFVFSRSRRLPFQSTMQCFRL